MKKYLSLIAVSALALGAGDVYAASTSANGTATATILAASGITKGQDLNFGNMLKGKAHTVTVNTSGARSGSDDGQLVGGGTVQAGTFSITGVSGLEVTITVPESITLSHKTQTTNKLTVSNVTMKVGTDSEQAAGSVKAKIPGEGGLSLAVGGTLSVTTSAAEGEYSGSYTVTMSY